MIYRHALANALAMFGRNVAPEHRKPEIVGFRLLYDSVVDGLGYAHSLGIACAR